MWVSEQSATSRFDVDHAAEMKCMRAKCSILLNFKILAFILQVLWAPYVSNYPLSAG